MRYTLDIHSFGFSFYQLHSYLLCNWSCIGMINIGLVRTYILHVVGRVLSYRSSLRLALYDTTTAFTFSKNQSFDALS